MAPRRGAATIAATAASMTATETALPARPNHSSGRGLKFNEPLTWRAGKPIAVGELIKRLTALSSELRDLDQDDGDRDSLAHVAKQLAGHQLLGHKDRGVRALTGCCLVVILRL